MVSLLEEFDVRLDWRGYFLHPEIPEGGVPVESLLGKKSSQDFMDYLNRFAANFNVPIAIPTHIPNTRRALLVTEYARTQGKLQAFKDATMDAYWLRSADIEDDKLLSSLAQSAGLDPGAALLACDDPKYQERIDTDLLEAKEKKVTGIPTLFIECKMIVGCLPYAELAKTAKKAGLKLR